MVANNISQVHTRFGHTDIPVPIIGLCVPGGLRRKRRARGGRRAHGAGAIGRTFGGYPEAHCGTHHAHIARAHTAPDRSPQVFRSEYAAPVRAPGAIGCGAARAGGPNRARSARPKFGAARVRMRNSESRRRRSKLFVFGAAAPHATLSPERRRRYAAVAGAANRRSSRPSGPACRRVRQQRSRSGAERRARTSRDIAAAAAAAAAA